MPGFGIGLINDNFHIAGIRQVVAERLKRVVMYSMALGPRCFKWKMLSLSGPKAFLFLQLLIAFITRSVVNVRISNDFLLVSLVTTLVSLEEVCLPSFEVLNCWLNLLASCLDDEIPLKVIASFSASRFALPSIPFIVLHSLVRSVFWSMVSTKSLHFFRLCTQMRFWMTLFNIGSSGGVGSLLQRSSRLFITSSSSAGTGSAWSLWRPVGMWCDAALSRTVRKIFSSLWQSVGRERLLRAASTSCLYLSQLTILGSHMFDVGLGLHL